MALSSPCDPSEDFGPYLSEMGGGEGDDCTGFNRIPLAAMLRTDCPRGSRYNTWVRRWWLDHGGREEVVRWVSL